MDASKPAAQTIDSYVLSLISQRGFPDMAPAAQAELKQDVERRLDAFLIDRLVDAFSEEDILTFNDLLEDGKSREDLLEFAQTHIDDYKTFLMDTLLDFEEIYLHQ